MTKKEESEIYKQLAEQKNKWAKTLKNSQAFAMVTKDDEGIKIGLHSPTKQHLAELSLYLKRLKEISEKLYFEEQDNSHKNKGKVSYIG